MIKIYYYSEYIEFRVVNDSDDFVFFDDWHSHLKDPSFFNVINEYLKFTLLF